MIRFPADAPSGPIIAHTDASRTRSLVPGKHDRMGFLRAHDQVLRELAEGRPLWFPSFNYEFLRSSEYHMANDPAQVGSINEYERLQNADRRTPTPVFNFVSNVPFSPNKLADGAIVYPFDDASVFGQGVALDGIVLWYGAPFSTATILHHAEGSANGPLYRYDKDFAGTVISSHAQTQVTLRYHVRPLDLPVDYAWDRIVSDAQKHGIIRTLNENAGVYWASARALVSFWVERQRRDALYLLDEASRNWIAPKLDVLGRRFMFDDFEGSKA